MKPLVSCLSAAILMNLLAFGANAVTSGDLVTAFDGSDGEIAKDQSQYGNDGTVEGDLKRVAGKFGQALEFNGTSDYVRIPKSDSLNLGKGSFSAEAWVNQTICLSPEVVE